MQGTISKFGQMMYGHLKLGSKDESNQLLDNIQEDLRGLGITIYIKKVQAVNTKEIC